MDANQIAQRAADMLAFKVARQSPRAAARCFSDHIGKWQADMLARPDVYTALVEAALPEFPPDVAAQLQQLGQRTRDYAAAPCEEKAEIDAWIDSLDPTLAADLTGIYMREGGYFTGVLMEECYALFEVPGFDAELEKIDALLHEQWKTAWRADCGEVFHPRLLLSAEEFIARCIALYASVS